MKFLFSLLLVFVTVNSAVALVTVNIVPNYVVYNYFYPAYLDPSNPAAQPQLFTITAINNEDYDIYDYQIWLDFQWRDMELVSDAIIEPKPGSPYDHIPANGIPLSISSKDIIVSDESNYFTAIEGLEFDDILEYNDEFKDLVLDLGYFPDGDYVFTIQLFDGQRNPLSDPATFTFTIITPTAITLISPGSPMGLGIPSVPDPNPYFVWFSNLNNYTLNLYEIEREELSAEDIELQLDPFFSADVSGSVIYAYPPSAPLLENEQIYAWQITSELITPLGDSGNEIKSAVYMFKISSDNSSEQENQILLNFLQQLSAEGIEEIISLLESGYSFESMSWKGQDMTVEGLYDILMQISSGEITIKQIVIE